MTSTFVLTTCTVGRHTGHTHTSPHISESKIPLHGSWESIRRIPDSRYGSSDSLSRIPDSTRKNFPDSVNIRQSTDVHIPPDYDMTPGYKFHKIMKIIDEQQCGANYVLLIGFTD